MNRPVILIAEDDRLLRDIFVRKLTSAGYTVHAAADGGEAIAFVKNESPDLMLCDIHMKLVDGWEVLKAFPRDHRTFPIIMVTNFDRPEDHAKADALGADGYAVKKDMTMQGLVAMVAKTLAEGEKEVAGEAPQS